MLGAGQSEAIRLSRSAFIRLFAASCFVMLAQATSAQHLMYAPSREWTKQAWQCRNRAVSLVEIERLRAPTSMRSDLKVVDLRINGRKVRSSSVRGLDEFVASLDAVRAVTSRCGGGHGEAVFIDGFVHGRANPRDTELREFFIRYAQ